MLRRRDVGLGAGTGRAFAEAIAAAASASDSGLKRSIFAAAATAAAPGQVKRDLSVLMEGCPASYPSRPKAARSPPGASGSRNEAPNLFSRASYYRTVVNSQVPVLLTSQCSLIPSLAQEGWTTGRRARGGGRDAALCFDAGFV